VPEVPTAEVGGATGGPAVTERSRPIRVMVVDDHPLTRSGLRAALRAEPDLELAGEAGGALEALALVDRARPDVVLVALALPGMDGFELTRRLAAGRSAPKVLVLTRVEGGDPVRRALEVGARGYLSKTASAGDVAEAIRAVHAGRRVLGPEAADALAQAVSAPAGGADLTAREREVLALVAAGLSNGRIAEQLNLAPSTVRFHLRSLRGKLGVATRAEAIAWAHRRGLVPPTP